MFGDSDFAATAGLGIQGNRDLFMNAVGWLSQQENLISIRPKDPDDRRITLTATQQANITWLSLLLPAGRDLRRRRLQLVAEAVDEGGSVLRSRWSSFSPGSADTSTS